MRIFSAFVIAFCVGLSEALRYDPAQVGFNLNENEAASDPLDYWGEWPNHKFHPSPSNWRMPMYTLFLDRFVNGDPSNDNVNETAYEHDIMSNQLRFGGDIRGLQSSLDYLQGMGIKTLYLAGSPMINVPWGSDGYSPLDLTLLDHHFGDIQTWRDAITEIHSRGMYIILDNTFATMGDLLGFEGYLNTSTPFTPSEHNALWKSDRRYHDFHQSNVELDHCDYPRFWSDDGRPVTNLTSYLVGCRDSEFDQYGEVASFGNYTEYQRQLSKFAFVQDRLREWRPSVLAKIQHFSCMIIASLDIDGMRIDKAIQVTLDAQGQWSKHIRECARQHNKNNFYIPGEIVSGNSFGAIYIGRGMEPEMSISNLTAAVSVTNQSKGREYIRELGENALDAAAFHYSIYRAMTRFLGLDGVYAAEGDTSVNFVESWNALIRTNDMVNAYTGEFDPRHMYGVSNQDVFRWPSIANGTDKNILGLFITTLLYPGIPTLFTGEEQAFYVLENTASNYVFGRAPMTSSVAWQLHGCYKVGSQKYANFPLEAALYGCEDDNVSLDHRDPSHPLRNIIKRMFELREIYPVLNDGYYLQQLANKTYDIYLPASNGTATETGLWSVYRSEWSGVQNLSASGGQGSQSIWMLYTNENETKTYNFDCNDKDTIIAPFEAGTTVKNLFAPYDEYTLGAGPVSLGLEGSTKPNGCLSTLTMFPWGFKAMVPKSSWVDSRPVITEFLPGHDYRHESTASTGNMIHFTLGFSAEMDCNAVFDSITINTTSTFSGTASIDKSSVNCSSVDSLQTYVGQPTTAWTFEADLVGLTHGIHQITLSNVSSSGGNSTRTTDSFLLRVGDVKNPMVFPKTGNFSTSLLFENDNGELYLSHQAPGADLWRYSLNFGTTFSEWYPYSGGNTSIDAQPWSGTKEQSWKGHHVKVQYWSQKSGSSDHFQSGDLNGPVQQPRRFPNLFLMGDFNNYGYDQGLANELHQDTGTGRWKANLMTEWPARVALNAWGMNPDGRPDATMVLGDVDGDNILDRIPPISLLENFININEAPPLPYLAYNLDLDDGSYRYTLIPVGSSNIQAALYFLLALIPVLSAGIAVWIFVRSFYVVKFNEYGNSAPKPSYKRQSQLQAIDEESPRTIELGLFGLKTGVSVAITKSRPTSTVTPLTPSRSLSQSRSKALSTKAGLALKRRRVLIATMEYDIEDWGLKIKIGGLGVMAQLMGKNLEHQDLIWVVPQVGDVDYPEESRSEEMAESMEVTILNELYTVKTRIHVLRNITYILLDAPIFRQQTKAEPYPPRMDDIESAVYYSAWNQCIAEAIRRFEPDLYHINDYHGALAPLHLLPDTIPCALSLHNAEFQGLWPMRTAEEREELCEVWNLEPWIVQQYVQFGEVFNLLHAGASYLRIHQAGFGAVGVSRKYGKRSFARYPIFWGLKGIGSLPNPDPTDTAEWDPDADAEQSLSIKINRKMESGRGKLRVEAQTWAGLNQDPNADLFVFVGRWSMQKGVDLIADIFPSILEAHPSTQLICIGPVIDLYGKFAAIKLDRMMKAYPGRVYSKPEFTALPPYLFSGAEFALIPSRDEPFGLVAVEFGRKGALGVGARVGGLGQMPGWWYTVESTSTKHLLHQFRGAIEGALATNQKTRALLRARSAKQRFPVAAWIQGLETLQRGAMKKSAKYASKGNRMSRGRSMRSSNRNSQRHSFYNSGCNTPGMTPSRTTSLAPSVRSTRGSTMTPKAGFDLASLQKALQDVGNVNMGSAAGPGHPSEASGPTSAVPATQHQAESDDESDGDEFYQQDHPMLKALGYAPPKPKIEYDEDWDDYFSQPNPALRGGDNSGAGDEVPPMPTLQDAFNRSIGQPETKKVGWGSFAMNLSDARDSTASLNPIIPKPSPTASLFPPVERSIAMATPTKDCDSQASTPQTPLSPIPPQTSSPRSKLHSSQNEDLGDMKDSLVISEALSRPESIFSEAHSQLTISAVTGGKKDLMIQQKVVPTFTDPAQDYQLAFEKRLHDLSAKNSYDTCIEEFIEKSEKDWFNRLRGLRMGNKAGARSSQLFQTGEPAPRGHFAQSVASGLITLAQKIGNEKYSNYSTPAESLAGPTLAGSTTGIDKQGDSIDQFAIEEGYLAPTGIKRLLLHKIGDWPFYSILLALGQLIAANSYQITLLTGAVGEPASKLYTVASIYLVTSAVWWMIYRHFQAIWCLSLPFIFYALAFFFIGLAALIPGYQARDIVQNLATGAYAIASSSGSLFFALNFGDQGGAPVTSWVFRACVIQGTQQLYIAMLWWWGSDLAQRSAHGASTSVVVSNPGLAMGVGWSVAALLLAVGFLLFRGLPEYYRQSPGAVPSFLPSVLRRKIVMWFFAMVILQNFFLSAPYGRNWLYLWSSAHVPGWGIAILTLVFFVLIWAAVMYFFSHFSKAHSWILPIFAMGIGAPRWCQMLWGVSGIGLYVPWAGGSGLGSALAGRALWLWLGLLDSLQGVGFGMILLHTLTRLHISFTLMAAQVLGSAVTMCARGFAPDNIGPGPVFPNLGVDPGDGLRNAWFWIALGAQLVIPALGFMFFRKEQLNKP